MNNDSFMRTRKALLSFEGSLLPARMRWPHPLCQHCVRQLLSLERIEYCAHKRPSFVLAELSLRGGVVTISWIQTPANVLKFLEFYEDACFLLACQKVKRADATGVLEYLFAIGAIFQPISRNTLFSPTMAGKEADIVHLQLMIAASEVGHTHCSGTRGMDANKWKSKVDGHPGDPHAPLMIFTYTANDAQHEVSREGTSVG
ncbi:hypothetical protein TNIN_279831 [Trichonephila inaurata madagascariensis]|uniref:Uncharacterized protein n=1 Tax=Trichonephila inaurata madagascariensis TaxID=2747483 RepID=A0A8X6X9X2_9ARAC|nr:hypothetical protein TNIN_279831 [Trichonephila inaurata madagascariensis]